MKQDDSTSPNTNPGSIKAEDDEEETAADRENANADNIAAEDSASAAEDLSAPPKAEQQENEANDNDAMDVNDPGDED